MDCKRKVIFPFGFAFVIKYYDYFITQSLKITRFLCIIFQFLMLVLPLKDAGSCHPTAACLFLYLTFCANAGIAIQYYT